MKLGDLVRYRYATPGLWLKWEVGLLVECLSDEVKVLRNDGTIIVRTESDVQRCTGRGYKKKKRMENER